MKQENAKLTRALDDSSTERTNLRRALDQSKESEKKATGLCEGYKKEISRLGARIKVVNAAKREEIGRLKKELESVKRTVRDFEGLHAPDVANNIIEVQREEIERLKGHCRDGAAETETMSTTLATTLAKEVASLEGCLQEYQSTLNMLEMWKQKYAMEAGEKIAWRIAHGNALEALKSTR
jgi:phage host-nuclease inhibitor protein Gam